MLLPPKLACDFLGKKLAGVLGLDAAKYQYAIDQYQQNHKIKTFTAIKPTASLLCLRSINNMFHAND